MNDWKEKLYDAYVSSGQAGGAQATTAVDAFGSRKPYYDQLIERHVPDSRDIEVLDLGCGSGVLLYFLREHGYQRLQGVDVSAEQVALARRFGLQGVQKGDVLAYLGDAADDSFDLVTAFDLLEHFTRPKLFDILAEIHRVLRPDGRLIAHVPNAEGIYGTRIRYGDMTHELAFTAKSAAQSLRAIGFEHIESHEDQPVIHGIKSLVRHAIWRTGTLWPRLLLAAETGRTDFILSQNLLVVAYKAS